MHHIFLPILRVSRPDFNGNKQLKTLIDGIPCTVQETVIRFQSACSNAVDIQEENLTPVQGEYMTLAFRLTWVVLRMVAAAEASDRDELRCMVEVTREILLAMETLMEVEEMGEAEEV